MENGSTKWVEHEEREREAMKDVVVSWARCYLVDYLEDDGSFGRVTRAGPLFEFFGEDDRNALGHEAAPFLQTQFAGPGFFFQ